MAPRELTAAEIHERVDTRHPATGLLYPPDGLQPWYDWLIRSLHLLAEASFGALRTTAEDVDAPTIRVAPGQATIAGTVVAFDGSVHDLTSFGNATVLVSLIDAGGGVGTVDVRTFTDGWPGPSHVKLAEVTIEAGVVKAMLDRRLETVFRVD